MDYCLRPSTGAPGRQITACIIASLPVFMAGIVLGWPSPVMDYISKGRAPVPLTEEQISWMVVCIDIGNFFMAIPAGRLMDGIGRKFTVYLSAPLMFVGWMFILFGRQAWCLFVARLSQGAAVGIAWVVAPSYVGEMASAQIRGQLGLLVQLSYAVGLLFSYSAGWLLADYTTLAVVSACVSVASGALFTLLPESPYYLMLNGQPDDAARSLWSLRSYAADELSAELATVKDSVLNDSREGNVENLLNRDRRPLAIVMVLAVLQMACGASVIEAYASTILSDIGVSANASTVMLGLVVLVAAVPFALAVDRCGRRPLMIASCFGTAGCQAAVAVFTNQNSGRWLLLFASLAGAQFFINVGIMPLLSVVQCEYFPSDTRALADTAVVLTVTLASTVIISVYKPVANAFGGVSADFAAYAALSAMGGLFCYFCMPETKRKSFAEIQTDFGNDKDEASAAMISESTADPVESVRKCDYEQIL